MKQRTRLGLLFAFAILLHGVPAAAQGKKPAGGSAGPTAAQVTLGDSLFHNEGNCYACHGAKGEGGIGANLTDAEWIHSKGSLEDISKQITTGVTKEESKSGVVMPPKGGSTLTDDQVKAVAAYVYSLSHKS